MIWIISIGLTLASACYLAYLFCQYGPAPDDCGGSRIADLERRIRDIERAIEK